MPDLYLAMESGIADLGCIAVQQPDQWQCVAPHPQTVRCFVPGGRIGYPRHVFHHQKMLAPFTEIIDIGHDIGMVKILEGFGFALKAP